MSLDTHDRSSPHVNRAQLRSFDLFKAMSVSELEDFVGLARVHRIQQNCPVMRQGDPARNFFCLLEGRLKVVQVTPRGQQIIVRIVNAGEIFGVAKALKRADYPATAMAVADSTFLAWSSNRWSEMTERHPALAMNAIHTLGQHVQEAHARITELSTEDVEHRLAYAIIRLAAQAGRRTEEGILIDFPITLQDIAEMTGTTHFTISRLLRAWDAEGLISRGRQRLTLLNLHKLEALAQNRSCT